MKGVWACQDGLDMFLLAFVYMSTLMPANHLQASVVRSGLQRDHEVRSSGHLIINHASF